jgi:hypothetical protein
MNQTPMRSFLEHILDTAEKPGEALVVLYFVGRGHPINGALRRAKGVDGLFELLAAAQDAPNSKPFLLHQFFEASAVSSVARIGAEKDLPSIIAPPSAGGIVAPRS